MLEVAHLYYWIIEGAWHFLRHGGRALGESALFGAYVQLALKSRIELVLGRTANEHTLVSFVQEIRRIWAVRD